MECGMKFIKYSLFAFNLVFFVIALVLIGVGAAVEIKYRSLTELTGSALSAAPVLLICVGVFILLVAFFGCCGAYKENYCMVTSFMIMMVVIVILEFAAGIAAFALKGKIEIWLKHSVQKSIYEYDPKLAKVFSIVQQKFKCCGGVAATDWKKSSKFMKQANATIKADNISRAATIVPDSCCVKETKNCGLTAGHTIYRGKENGCVEKIEVFVKKNAIVIGGVGIGIAFIEIVGIVFACCLMRAIKKQYEVV